MQEAFAGLKKQTAEWKVSPEVLDVLQTVFAGRYGHIQHVYIIETCYAMSLLGGEVRSSRDRLEKQYATLAQWVAKEQIKPEVARKARQLIAQQVEFLALVPRVEGGKGSPQEEEFVKALSAGQEADSAFPVSDRSQQVARLIVELCRP
jgi:hypothetical protein